MKSKIDIEKWKEFNITDLFQVKLSSDDLQPGKLVNGDIPLVSSGKNNNGIVMYIEEQKDATLYNENTITIDMFGKAFYQSKRYYAVSHGRINILIPKFELTKNIGMFLVSILEKSFEEKYSFTTMCSSTLLKNEKIKLPTDNNENPDWNYMEQYMKNIEEQSRETIKWLNKCNKESKKIKTTKWGNFVIEDLFEIKRPCARSQSNYEDGEIPFIASGNYNNGVLKYLKPKENERLDKGNCITVSPVDGSAFYQKNDFLGRGGAGSSIILLYNDNLNENNGTFMATIIRKICCKYGYNNMGSKETIRKEIIKLPIDEKGNPDYDYMDKYMSELVNKTKNKLSCLNNI